MNSSTIYNSSNFSRGITLEVKKQLVFLFGFLLHVFCFPLRSHGIAPCVVDKYKQIYMLTCTKKKLLIFFLFSLQKRDVFFLDFHFDIVGFNFFGGWFGFFGGILGF